MRRKGRYVPMVDSYGDMWGQNWVEEPGDEDENEPDPFDFSRLYGEEKYSLNNMLLKAVNCPRQRNFEGKAFDVWDDRIGEKWWEAVRLIKSTMTADAFFAGATEESFMEFAREVAKTVNFGEVTGARVVRFTNAGGYPTLRLDLIREEKKA